MEFRMLHQEMIKEPDELSEELNSELVFFDTFSHDNNDVSLCLFWL